MSEMSATKSTKRVYKVPKPGEEIVISGIAGRFPNSDNMEELKNNLLNKVDMVSDDDRRWKLDHPEIPQRTGKLNNVSKFDTLFFGVHFKQAQTMDPMCRMLLEHAYEAIVDAGINPKQIRGSRTGVFVGACFSESEKTWFYEKLQINGFGITGCSRAMLANRISYWLGVIGPSYTLDSACSSSLFALEHAFRCMQNGQCDAAIVGGSNLCLHPYISLQFFRLGVLSRDGRCKCFDTDADGYARSEAITVVYLQKAKNAKRIYATVVYGKTNCDGYKKQGIIFPSSEMQGTLMRECYEDCGLSPNILSYLECHSTGSNIGDTEEILAVDSVFCKSRKIPLLIGSVKSNLGHTEPASGLCQVAKVLLAMETGIIPGNLHFNRPREGLKALEEGRLKVVTDSTPWEGGYVGINSFGFGGANCHIILKSNPKKKINNGAPSDDLPRLVVVSGRNEKSVTLFLNDIEKHPIDVEYIRLLHDIHIDDIQGHLYRGYTIVGSKTAEQPTRQVENYLGTKRPIWFVFSGMGSQWPGMGIDLMRFPIFAKAIQKCDDILRPRGVDIINILTNKDKSIFDNILNSFVGIAAIQIGLFDLLTSIGIVPDNIIGHSVGELGCAYADGTFTAEQMILSAYSRGLVSIETEIIYGSMAAIGLGFEDIKNMCPPDIEVACHNAADSSTISGPAESMKKFVAELQAKKIFAKEVACSNIPYHSRYIAPAGPKLLACLSEIIPEPKPRSRKWLSTSIPQNKWSTASAKLSSAEYHTNNLLNPVLFEETSRMIPKNAVTIEIAPHSLLQAILRRSLGSEVTNIGLTQRNHKDNTEVFLQAIGKLYNIGLQPEIANLYPPIEFPVSRGTPMISPSVRWEHSDDWYVTAFKMQKKVTSGEKNIKLSLMNENFEYMAGHVIDGENLIPATAYLTLVWEIVGLLHSEMYSDLSVVFEHIIFKRALHISKEDEIELTIMVQKGTGRFEVSENSTTVASGVVRISKNPAQEKIPSAILPNKDEEEVMTTKDIYKELRLRGYQYSGLFRSLKSASISRMKGHIAWMGNWVTYLDNMLQIMILGMDTRDLYIPVKIQKIVIDTKLHQQEIQKLDLEDRQLPVHVYKELETIISGGVEIRGVKSRAILRQLSACEPVLEEYKFVPYCDGAQVSLQEAIRLATHIAIEYHQAIHVKTIELIDDSDNMTINELASPILIKILADLPLIQANVLLISPNRFGDDALSPNVTSINSLNNLYNEENALLAVGIGLLTKNKSDKLEQILSKLRNGGFVLTREKSPKPENLSALSKYNLDVILEKNTSMESIILLKKKNQPIKQTEIIHINNNEFTWLEKLNSIMNKTPNDMRIILVGEKDPECGLLGFVNCLRKEPGGEMIRGILIQDTEAPKFSLQNSLYAKQLQLDLPINVLRPEKIWGSYRHEPLLNLSKLKPVYHAFVNQTVRGDLSSLHWAEGPIRPDTKQKDLIHVVYSAINFRDVMLATGKLTPDSNSMSTRFNEYSIGSEYAGIDTAGRRVMGLCQNRGLSNMLVPDRDLSWDVPDNWSLEDAATVPCVYAVCYYALYMHGEMKKGDKVLIHSGTSGIGQAAIHLALHEGCEIFTTVGSPEKRKFIREMFPSIPDDHIGSTRNTSFEQMILTITKGDGINIVLNSLPEEKLQASVRCLAQSGHFLEIGKCDLTSSNSIGMMIFLKEISFHGIVLENVLQIMEEKINLKNYLSDGLKNGAIKPLVRKIFEKNEVEAAFRYMVEGKHMGKVILKICDEKQVGKVSILAQPQFYCDDDKSYLILGGLGGFALELVDWLILRGAKNLVLTSRTGIKTGYQRMKTDLWKSYGVNVLIITGVDATNRKDCEFILKSAEKQGPVDAIFNLAVVRKDSICKNQTPKSFEESFKAKVWSTKTLDELSRKLCPRLQQFVVFSSVSCGRGNVGQTNHGMANSAMERICERRVADGLPGLAIQWGAIGDVGFVAELQDDTKELVISGTSQQKISSCLEKLEEFLLQNRPVVSSMVVAKRVDDNASVAQTIANIIGVKDIKTVSEDILLTEFGMDSKMTVEIKQTLEDEFDIFLTANEIRTLTFAKLAEICGTEDREKTQADIEEEKIELFGKQLFVRVKNNEDMISDIGIELSTRKNLCMVEVFLLPGIDGCGYIFNPLASRIKPVATVLQYGINNIGLAHGSIAEYADHLLPYILPKAEKERTFILIAYSYGSLVAIELARRLENHALNGQLVLIDGAPDLMKAIIEQFLPSETQEELQNNILLYVMNNLQPAANEKLLLHLNKCTTWEQKLDSFVSHFASDNTSLSIENQKALCTTLYSRVLALQKYDVSSLTRIRAPITLLKPTKSYTHMAEEDYGLHKITRDKVKVHYVEGNHVTMLDNDKIITAINGESLIDLKTFEKLLNEDQSLEFEEDENTKT